MQTSKLLQDVMMYTAYYALHAVGLVALLVGMSIIMQAMDIYDMDVKRRMVLLITGLTIISFVKSIMSVTL